MSEVVSNVDLDLTGQSPTMPQFKDIVVQCTTGEVRIEEEEGKRTLKVPLVFEEAATAVDGRVVQPGFNGCTVSIGLFTVGKRDKEMIQRDVLRFQCAALRIKQGKPFDAGECSGKRVGVHFSLREDQRATPEERANGTARQFQDYKFLVAK